METTNIDLLIGELFKIKAKALTLLEIKNIYLSEVKVKCRPDTYIYYEKQLNVIINFLHNKGAFNSNDVTIQLINEFITNERKRNIKNITLNKSIGTLKQAFKYCYRREWISKNPLEFWDNLPKEDIEIKTITDDVIKQVFSYFDMLRKNTINIRNKAIFLVLLTTGIRRNELLNLKFVNLDLEKQSLKLDFTKTKKNRIVFLDNTTKKALSDYLDKCQPKEYLFCNVGNKGKIYPKCIDALYLKIKRALKLPKEVSISPHKWRHTYATMCLENGASLEFVRKTLGHSTLNTTQKYLHLSTAKLAEEHIKVNPLNRLKLD